jgi:hypothetical protein
MASCLTASIAAGQAAIVGTVNRADDARPLPHASVSVTAAGAAWATAFTRERFADSTGAFRITGLTSGVYRIHAREIAFSPLDTTITVDAAMTSIQLSLAPTGFVRPRRTVEGARSEADTRDRDCVSTGVPQSSDSAERAIVFSALDASVGRFRLLRAAYPFRYQLERRFTTVSKGKELLQSMDTVTVDSRAWNSYKPGHLFTVTPGTNLLGGHYHEDVYVPSVQDLADSTFKAAHCYGYGGADTADGAAAVRIDFRPRSSFQFPDVSGSIYLDATRGFIRRVVFRVTHADLAPVPIIALSASTTFRDIAPSVQVLDRLESVEWLDATGDSRRVEQDRFLTYMFLYGAPGSQ